MSRVLTITFRSSGERWEFTVEPEGELAQGPFEWKAPPHPRMLLPTLLGRLTSVLDAQTPWRLRLRGDGSATPTTLPAFAAWPYLEHPRGRTHVFNLEWTVAEQCFDITYARVRDAIGVIPAEGSALVESLSSELLHPVARVSADGPFPQETVLVVEADVDDDEAMRIQDAAYEAGCPLLVWCASNPPPRVPINEIVTLDAPATPTLTWLSHLLPKVLTGTQGPEKALADAACGRGVAAKDCNVRWLRGNFDRWETCATLDRYGFPEHWDVTFDRSQQESELTGLLDTLVAKKTLRRVQVVISAGPDGAGLRRFQARPPLWREGSEQRVCVERAELDWHDRPSLQIHRVCAEFDARDVADLASKLAARAEKSDKPVLLVWLSHRVASLDDATGTRRVSVDDLRAYIASLMELGRELPQRVRVLVHVSVQGAPASSLEALSSRPGAHAHAAVLEELSRNAPAKDLRNFFDSHGLLVTDEELNTLATVTYDDAIRRLQRRMSAPEE